MPARRIKRHEPVKELRNHVDRGDVLGDAWIERGLNGVYDSLGSRDFLRGRRIELDGESGVGVKIDRDGRFLVDVGGEQRAVESGEILYER